MLNSDKSGSTSDDFEQIPNAKGEPFYSFVLLPYTLVALQNVITMMIEFLKLVACAWIVRMYG